VRLLLSLRSQANFVTLAWSLLSNSNSNGSANLVLRVLNLKKSFYFLLLSKIINMIENCLHLLFEIKNLFETFYIWIYIRISIWNIWEFINILICNKIKDTIKKLCIDIYYNKKIVKNWEKLINCTNVTNITMSNSILFLY